MKPSTQPNRKPSSSSFRTHTSTNSTCTFMTPKRMKSPSVWLFTILKSSMTRKMPMKKKISLATSSTTRSRAVSSLFSWIRIWLRTVVCVPKMILSVRCISWFPAWWSMRWKSPWPFLALTLSCNSKMGFGRLLEQTLSFWGLTFTSSLPT